MKRVPKRILIQLRILIPVFFIIIFIHPSFAQKDKDKLKQNKQKIQKEIEFTNKLLNETKKNKKSSLNKLLILNNQISKREELINNTNSEIQLVDSKITQNKNEVDRLQFNLQSLKDEYAKMIYYAYKNRNSYDRLMFLFSSKDFYQAYRRLKYLQQYSQYRKKQAEMIQATQSQLSDKVRKLSTVKNEKQYLVIEQESEKTKLADEKEEQNSTYKELQQKEKKLLETLKEKEAAAKKLQKAIEDIIAKEIAKAEEEARAKAKIKKDKISENKTTATTETHKSTPLTELSLTPDEQTLSTTFSNNKGKLPWPSANGIISNTFGPHEHPVLPGIKTMNNGIDITTSQNTKARAVFDGKVTGVITIPGAGKAIIIRHGEYLSVYSNLEEVYVKMGDKVKTKQDIGLISTNTSESKTELHFELWKGKVILNPASWLASQR